MKIHIAALLASPLYTAAFQQPSRNSLTNTARKAIAIPTPNANAVTPPEPKGEKPADEDQIDMTGIALSVSFISFN